MNPLDPAHFYVGDKLAWDGSRLVVTDPDLLARIDKPYLSASTAKSVHGCQAKWVGEKALPDSFDLFSPTEKGSAAHLVLEELYQLPAARRDPKHAAAILTSLPRRDPAEGEVDYGQALGTDPVRYTQWVTMVTDAYKGIFDIENPQDIDVYSTELRLDGIEVGGVPFKGFIDRVDVLADGSLGVRDYKGLALDTPIPTPTGWTTMGDLAVGDEVIASDGSPTRVTVKSQVHHRPCYRITLEDGSQVVCDNVHLWQVTESRDGRQSTDVVSADELYERFVAAREQGHIGSLTLPSPKPLQTPEAPIPGNPLVAGSWLADFTPRPGAPLPVEYLRGSVEQRIAFLRGLMDAGGTWEPDYSHAVFATASAPLADMVVELVRSFGIVTQSTAWTRKATGRPATDVYHVPFVPTDFNPFSVPHKARLVDEHLESVRSKAPVASRYIAQMEPVESVPTQCIQVDAPDSLYACGEGMVMTHNTGKDKSTPNPRFDDDHGDQIRLYVAALRRWLRERGEDLKVTDGRLFYIEHGKLRSVDIGESALRKTTVGFADAWRTMKTATASATFEAHPSPLCGWCPLVMACPVARPARKPNDPRNDPEKKDGLLQAVDLGIPKMRRSRASAGDGQNQAPAAHTPGGQNVPGTSESILEDTMSTERPYREVKPWDTDGGRVDGHLMMAAPHATAVIGLVSLAAEQVGKYNLQLGPANVRTMTSLLAKVVLDAQATVTNGSTDWGEGSNTRARGALHTVLDLLPIPFPEAASAPHKPVVWVENAEALATWQQRATTFVVTIMRTGIALFEGQIDLDFTATVPTEVTARGAAS